jgi:uncharacterized protein YkwD
MLSTFRRALVTSVVVGLIVVAFPFTTPGAAARSCWSWSGSEQKLARLTNGARTRRSLSRLSLDPELSKVADVHSREMARKGTLYHTRSSTLQKRVTRSRRLGENVGYGTSVRRIHRGFMRSYSHRANILSRRFSHFGVGIRSARGYRWVTVVFATSSNPGTTLKMPC